MSKKVRVIVNDVSFYTTQAQIKRGVGDSINLNKFVLDALESCIRCGIKGIGRTYYINTTLYQIQINL
jgi:hypothetical protein